MYLFKTIAVLCLTIVTFFGLLLPVVPQPQSVFELPLIVGLGETVRNLFFHVPLAWVALIGFISSLYYGIRYLRSANIQYDIRAYAAAEIGFIFCILATLTGALWAKVTWGSLWNWDPRETSIVFLFLVYTAYFLLRTSIREREMRARLSSIYGIFSGVSALFFMFVLPRITRGLHPGAQGDEAGPVPVLQLSAKSSVFLLLLLSLIGFTCLFLWIFNLKVRVMTLTEQLNDHNEEQHRW